MRDASLKQRIPCIIRISIFGAFSAGKMCALYKGKYGKGIGIWKLPAPKNAEYKKWRDDWLNELTKSREMDKNFESQISNDKVYTCKKHFRPEDIEICKYRSIFAFLLSYRSQNQRLELTATDQ